jgi:hypothetical protein
LIVAVRVEVAPDDAVERRCVWIPLHLQCAGRVDARQIRRRGRVADVDDLAGGRCRRPAQRAEQRQAAKYRARAGLGNPMTAPCLVTPAAMLPNRARKRRIGTRQRLTAAGRSDRDRGTAKGTGGTPY